MWRHCYSSNATVPNYRCACPDSQPPDAWNVARTEQFTPVISPVIFAANPRNLPGFGPFSFTAMIWLVGKILNESRGFLLKRGRL
jgi:hypothetical protein